MTQNQFKLLQHFRGTGKYVGKDAKWKHKPFSGDWRKCQELRELGLLEHCWGVEWYLTEAGRAFLKWPQAFSLEAGESHESATRN